MTTELAKQCAMIDGACIHDWVRLGDSCNRMWVCSKCGACQQEYTPESPPTTLPYDTDLNIAVKFARRMGAAIQVHRSTVSVVVAVRISYRGDSDEKYTQPHTEYYKDHNNDECVAEATAICRAVIAVKGG